MTQGTQGADQTTAGKQTQDKKAPAGGEAYTYKDSGIRERHGTVPFWLQLVAYGLIIWGIYYGIQYWNAG
jgi:hypothetical protein